MGSESLRSDYDFTRSFLPGLPGVSHIDFNDETQLEHITCRTACVVLEPVQAESGVHPPQNNYLQKVRKRCTEVGALMILDEIQTGFGRTGHLFAHQKYDVVHSNSSAATRSTILLEAMDYAMAQYSRP